jgi:hypothetical protein
VSGQIANATLALPSGLTVAANTGIGTTSPDGALHAKGISDHGRIVIEAGGTTGSTNNTFINFHNSGGTEVSQITVEETATNEGQMVFKTGGTTTGMTIDKDGAITKPLQPAFLAVSNSTVSNIAINTTTTISFNYEVFDQNADYNTSNYTFTAPVTGRYQLNAQIYMYQMPENGGYSLININTSNRSYLDIFSNSAHDSEITYNSLKVACLADMDANDTAYVTFYQQTGTAQADIQGSGSNQGNTQFSGFLAC